MAASPLAGSNLEAATAVTDTPSESAALNTSAKVSSHFSSSLDHALKILKQQERASTGSATPVNWATTVTETGSVASACTSDYCAPDDLILDPVQLETTPSSHQSRLSLASTVAVDSASRTNVVKPKSNVRDIVNVECQVRARIPYPDGHFYLHLYHNDEDNKEHLAIVFGDDIRSASLETAREGETDLDRKIRGASTGPQKHLIKEEILHRKNASQPSSPLKGPHASHASGNPAHPNPGTTIDRPSFDLDPEDAFESSRVSVVSAPLVRIHSECFTGETVSSVRCDCGYQLAEAMRLIQKEGRGVIVYLRQEGRGIGLLEKLKAYNLQDMGHDTVDANLLLNHPADARTYGSARAILDDLGIKQLRLLTNNTDKIRQLRGHSTDLNIVCHVPMYPRWWDSDVDDMDSQLSYTCHLGLKKDVMAEADRYLKTKAQRMGHMLSLDSAPF